MKKYSVRLASAAVALALLGAACGDDDEPTTAGQSQSSNSATQGSTAPSATTGAATLRAGLTGLLTEHVYLAALATGSALRGDTNPDRS